MWIRYKRAIQNLNKQRITFTTDNCDKVILCLLRSFGTLLIAFGSLSNWVVNPLEKQASTELYKWIEDNFSPDLTKNLFPAFVARYLICWLLTLATFSTLWLLRGWIVLRYFLFYLLSGTSVIPSSENDSKDNPTVLCSASNVLRQCLVLVYPKSFYRTGACEVNESNFVFTYFFFSGSYSLMICRQPPHQVAQKSINCTFPLWRAMRAVNSSFSGTCGASQIVNFFVIVCCRGCIWRFMSWMIPKKIGLVISEAMSSCRGVRGCKL